MKVYAYLRVSTEMQAKSGAGIAGQLHSIKLYAAERGMLITEVFRRRHKRWDG